MTTNNRRLSHLLLLGALAVSTTAAGQAMYFGSARVADNNSAAEAPADSAIRVLPADSVIQVLPADSVATAAAEEPVQLLAWPLLTDYATVDEYMAATAALPYDTVVNLQPLPRTFFMPAVFSNFEFDEHIDPFEVEYSGNSATRWIEGAQGMAHRLDRVNRYLYYRRPQDVPYNINLLPEAPKRYTAVVNPEDHTIEIMELPTAGSVAPTVAVAPVQKRHWLSTFSASLQFSQAYVSPNWYQGGNNNLNALANIYYNVKLNQAYHPNLLFETTVQYKLGMNNAPDDSIHAYNISDDLFQLTSTFGVKAARRWYYSLSVLFKTQLLQSYNSNSDEMRSAFLSPGELNIGLGMTYNYENAPKTVKFDASIAPLSYNLKTCTNSHINPELYEITPGRKTRHKFGSSTELKFMWRLAHNITYTSRLFAFTDYSNAYADWENTVGFEINKFLTTQIYVHARYDSATPRCDDPDWHKLQIKEIFSIGFAYKFSSI